MITSACAVRFHYYEKSIPVCCVCICFRFNYFIDSSHSPFQSHLVEGGRKYDSDAILWKINWIQLQNFQYLDHCQLRCYWKIHRY